MGNWTIQIRGLGVHHNGAEKDADEMAKQLVTDLVHAGHQIESADFTVGPPQDLRPPASAPLPPEPATKP